jgi:5-methyltetrahydropteroyltriglutamate--homocysteine methyltransferase
MKRSIDRILTTHTGSLPRPMDLSAMLEEFDSGELRDGEKFESRVREAVAEVVKIQVDAGVDVVSDGEQGKVGYSTYVRHRLTGFDGEGSATAR